MSSGTSVIMDAKDAQLTVTSVLCALKRMGALTVSVRASLVFFDLTYMTEKCIREGSFLYQILPFIIFYLNSLYSNLQPICFSFSACLTAAVKIFSPIFVHLIISPVHFHQESSSVHLHSWDVVLCAPVYQEKQGL